MFEWKDDFSVKIPLLDEQHKKLFEIGENVHLMLTNADGEDTFTGIIAQVKELIKYTKYHFEQEELLMKKFNFDGVDAHVAEHKQFIRYIESLDYNQIDNHQVQTLTDLVQFLAKWIFKHIINTDFQYSDTIQHGLANEHASG